MLAQLSIENIALIDKLELELGAQLNILSGETGAGKSIIIDSLNFVLGERADKALIRYGTDCAVVQAVFSDFENSAVTSYLEEMGLDCEDVLIIRRKMNLDGKNECRINGRISTLSILKGLTELLVDIHGQHEHQSLLKASNHIDLLDGIGENKVARAKAEVRALHKNYVLLKREYATIGNADERERKLDILDYQISEIERADIADGEEDELLDKRKRIRNMEKILSAIETVQSTLDAPEKGVGGELKNASAVLGTISSFDDRIDSLRDRLESAKAEISDIGDTLSDMLGELDFDSKSADDIEQRLETVRNLQRKYGGSYQALSEFYENAKAEAEALAGAGNKAERLEKEIADAGGALKKAAAVLTDLRKNCAEKFEKSMLKELSDLGMSGSTFQVSFSTVDNADEIGETGADSVEFLISPNVGEPLKPLAKIISGGEMSRFMLALKNIVADVDGIGTMVFDEIDTGISGSISAVVSQKLCNISRRRQVIAVTHMPSLAAMADSHYLIEKSTENGKTLTHIRLLDDDTEEIARLIGGSDYSMHALPHANEMKTWAHNYKTMRQKH